jgi:hypothetical protein
MNYLLPLSGTQLASHFQPYQDNKHQQYINDFWSCIFKKISGAELQTSIGKEFGSVYGQLCKG